jgi:CheY-like chemotaxis protein
MLSRRLQRRGFEVECAVDGQAGVDAARRTLPDLILMDMSLPVMDGWTATRELKQAEETRGIPVIALTAHAMSGDREKAAQTYKKGIDVSMAHGHPSMASEYRMTLDLDLNDD